MLGWMVQCRGGGGKKEGAKRKGRGCMMGGCCRGAAVSSGDVGVPRREQDHEAARRGAFC